MLVSWSEVERRIRTAMVAAATKTVDYTKRQYISSLGAVSSQLRSSSTYVSRVSSNGSSVKGYVTPYATPRPSVMSGYTVHAGTLPEMIEFGWRMDLRTFALTGRGMKVKRPAYPTKDRVQEAMNAEFRRQLQSNLTSQGFSVK